VLFPWLALYHAGAREALEAARGGGRGPEPRCQDGGLAMPDSRAGCAKAAEAFLRPADAEAGGRADPGGASASGRAGRAWRVCCAAGGWTRSAARAATSGRALVSGWMRPGSVRV